MKKSIASMLLLLALIGTAQAQLRKCTGPDGRITYSDVLCATTSKSAQTLDELSAPRGYQSPSAERPSQTSIYEREISGKIGAHLLQNNYERAEALAITPEHYQMIADARRDKKNYELDRKAAARAARPTVCRSFGIVNGSASNFGGPVTSYNGFSSGTTVCNK